MKKKTDSNLLRYDYPSACAFYLGAIIVSLVCQALVAFVAAGLNGRFPNLTENGDFNGAFMIIIQAANAAFIYLFGKLRKRRLNFTYFRGATDNKPPRVVDYVLPPVCALLLLIGMYLPTLWFGYITKAMGVPADAGAIAMDTPSAIVMVVIASVFLAPVCEESIYRGVLLHGLNERLTAVKAVLLSALAFTLMHMSPLQIVFQFAMGVLCGFIALKSKRLLPTILTHACGNALALIVAATPLGNSLAGCEAWLVDNIAAAFFITLGLFVGGGAALFALVRFGFGYGNKAVKKPVTENVETENKAAGDAGAPDASRDTENTADATDGANAGQAANAATDGYDDADKRAADTARGTAEEMRRRDGRFKYFIGIGICLVMVIINLVALVWT